MKLFHVCKQHSNHLMNGHGTRRVGRRDISLSLYEKEQIIKCPLQFWTIYRAGRMSVLGTNEQRVEKKKKKVKSQERIVPVPCKVPATLQLTIYPCSFFYAMQNDVTYRLCVTLYYEGIRRELCFQK